MANDPAHAALLAELSKFDFFQGLSPSDLDKVAAAVTEARTFTPGQVLVEQGEVSMECLLVAEGSAEVRRGTTVVSSVHAGEPVGEIGAAEYAYRTASVIADTPTRVYVIPARRFRELLDELPDARARLEQKVKARLAELRGETSGG